MLNKQIFRFTFGKNEESLLKNSEKKIKQDRKGNEFITNIQYKIIKQSKRIGFKI